MRGIKNLALSVGGIKTKKPKPEATTIPDFDIEENELEDENDDEFESQILNDSEKEAFKPKGKL